MALGKPKLSTKTPDADDTNVLMVDGVHDALIAAFRSSAKSNRRFIVAAVAVDEVVTKEGGAQQAKISLRHIEFTTEEALLEAYRERTKNAALPGDDSANQLPGLQSGGDEKSQAEKDAEFDAAAPGTPPTE